MLQEMKNTFSIIKHYVVNVDKIFSVLLTGYIFAKPTDRHKNHKKMEIKG